MPEASSPPIEGPVFYAKVGRLPSTAKREGAGASTSTAEDTEGGQKPPLIQRVFSGLAGCCFITWLGLTVAALIHRQWAGLEWLGGGLLCQLMISAVIQPMKLWRDRQERFRKIAGPALARDEQTVVLADRLKDYTASGALGSPPSATGADAWLIQEGLILSNGRRLSWSDFTSFCLDTSSQRAHRVRLQWPTMRLPVLFTLASMLLCISAGFTVELVGLHLNFRRYGDRDDVLALLFGASTFLLMTAWLLAMLSHLAHRQGKTLGALLASLFQPGEMTHNSDWLALVSREAVSEEELLLLLTRHLPQVQ